jgi:nitrate reductase gamma subunit
VSAGEVLLWVILPYVAIAVFVVGHIWRYRTDQFAWTSRSTELLDRGVLGWASPAFHYGALAAIGGHVLGILVPRSWTEALGISDDVYHWLAVVAGMVSGAAVVIGFGILCFRRLRVPRVWATTLRSDLVLYPVLAAAIVTGMLATVWGSAIEREEYRETVSPWFRGLFVLQPREDLMASASLVFQAHALIALLLFALWPFTRLVHVWSVPVTYVGRAPILYRRRGKPGSQVPSSTRT